MKKVSTTTSILAACMSASMLLSAVGCGSTATPVDQSAGTQKQAYSGVDIFRGVYFGDGPVAQLLPEMWGPEAARAVEAQRSPQQLMAQLEYSITRMKAEGWSDAIVSKAQTTLDSLRNGGQVPEVSAEQANTAKQFVLARLAESDPTFLDRFGADLQSGDQVRIDAAMTDASARLKATLNTLGETGTKSVDKRGVWFVGAVVVAVAAVAVVVIALVDMSSDPDPSSAGSRLRHAELINHLAVSLH
jgi:SdpC family antimicrobial peptide